MKKGIFLMLVLVIFILTSAAEYKDPIGWQSHDMEGYEDIEIQTQLTNYIFSTKGGVLKSAFLHFAPYGLQKEELIPDVETQIGEGQMIRTYLEGAIFPFALFINGEKDERVYEFIEEERNKDLMRFRLIRETEGLRIVKLFTVHNDPSYTVDLQLQIENLSDVEVTLSYEMVLGAEAGEERYIFDGKRTKDIPDAYDKFGGLGFVTSRYVLFLKNNSEGVKHWAELDERLRKVIGVKVDKITIAPGQKSFYSFTLYAGRPKYTLLERSGLEIIVDVGLFSQLLIPVVKFLDWLYQATGNYGWAIIIFTFVTRIVLFPLMRQQFRSMAKMQQIQPKMEKLRQRYPTLAQLRQLHPKMSEGELRRRAEENRRKLSEKMMELYKKEGINPLGGCLPMLLQLPILIILWRAILYSSEQIHFSPGFLWIEDLSLHDPTYIIVILTVIVMLLQSKLTPTAGGQNQLLLWGMPILMGLWLRNFPAGMWLYWFLTTAFQVLQQGFVNWEMKRKLKPKEPEE